MSNKLNPGNHLPYPTVAERMRLHFRKKYGTQTKAAEHFGVSATMISFISNGISKPTQVMLDDAGIK